MQLLRFFLLAFFALSLITCSGDVPDTESLNKEIAGVYKLSSGDSFSGLNLTTFQYFQFNEDGTAHEIHIDTATNIVASIDFIFSVINDTTVSMALSSGAGDRKLVNKFPVLYQAFGGGNLYFYEKTDDTVLTLTDNSGNTITLTEQDELPDEALCLEFSEPTAFADLEPEPVEETNLVWDGTSLWYEENESRKIYPVNPSTGEVGSAYDVSAAGQYTHIHAYQAGEFWAHCHCGNTNDAKLIDSAGAVSSTLNTDTDLSHEISIASMAFDGTYLWLFGQNETTDDYEFIKVDTSGPTLSGVFAFNFDLEAITWDGTYFWAITDFYSHQFIIKINPDSAGFTSAATYKVPYPGIEWKGIASVGSDIYFLGLDEAAVNKGVITKVTP